MSRSRALSLYANAKYRGPVAPPYATSRRASLGKVEVRNYFLWSRFIATGSFFSCLAVVAYVQAAELGEGSRSDRDRVPDKQDIFESPQSKAAIEELNRRFGEKPILPKPGQEKANIQGAKKQDDEKVPGSLSLEPNEKSGHGHHLEGACALRGLSESECERLYGRHED